MTYTYQNEAWQVTLPEVLRVDVPELGAPGVQHPAVLPRLHAALVVNPRLWHIARALWGFHPEILPPDTEATLLTPSTKGQVATRLGLTRAQLQAEIGAIRGIVQSIVRDSVDALPPATDGAAASPGHVYDPRSSAKAPSSTPEVQDLFAAAKVEDPQSVLAEFGFGDPKMLSQLGVHKDWFLQRVIEWRPILRHKMAGDLGRSTLLLALRVRWLGDLVASTHPGDEDYDGYVKDLRNAEESYREALPQLNEIAPWMGLASKGAGFAGVLADLTKAIQEYKARNDTRLVDGIFAASEVVVQLRRSVQAPLPQYRAGWVAYMQAAKAGFWDPNWTNPIPLETLRLMDHGFKEAYARAADQAGVHVPDLLKDGADGEYQDQLAGEGK